VPPQQKKKASNEKAPIAPNNKKIDLKGQKPGIG
jgi:hypothetical protein